MLLAIDVGNTNTVLGIYKVEGERSELAAHWRVTTHRSQTADEYGVLFVNLFEMNGMSPSQVHHIIISSVVPPVEGTLRQVCETYFHLQPIFVEPGIKTGMPVLVDNPTELGADRLVNAVAAFERYGGPCVVVDFGTATTFDVVSAKGEYLGANGILAAYVQPSGGVIAGQGCLVQYDGWVPNEMTLVERAAVQREHPHVRRDQPGLSSTPIGRSHRRRWRPQRPPQEHQRDQGAVPQGNRL